MLQGLLDVIVDPSNKHGAILLELFVFKIIPILNPDGVSRGYWRLDTNSINLNRYYQEPSLELHPSIFAAKAAVLQQHENGKLSMYFDLHSHSTKRSCFIIGNTIDDREK